MCINLDYMCVGCICLQCFFDIWACFFSMFRTICKLAHQKTLQRRALRYAHVQYCAEVGNNVMTLCLSAFGIFLCCVFLIFEVVFAINADG